MMSSASHLSVCRSSVLFCSDSFTVGWYPPIDASLQPLEYYTVWVKDTATSTYRGPYFVLASAPALLLPVSAVVSGRVYDVNVTATAATGTSPPSALLTVTPRAQPPAPPSLVRGINTTTHGVNVTWDGVTSGASSHATRDVVVYTVTSSPDGVTATTTDTTVWVGGLRNGVGYYFTVQSAIVGAGASAPSKPSAYPCYPGGLPPPPPVNVSVVGVSTSLVVSWATVNPAAVVNYILTASGPDGFDMAPVMDIPPYDTSYTIADTVAAGTTTQPLLLRSVECVWTPSKRVARSSFRNADSRTMCHGADAGRCWVLLSIGDVDGARG